MGVKGESEELVDEALRVGTPQATIARRLASTKHSCIWTQLEVLEVAMPRLPPRVGRVSFDVEVGAVGASASTWASNACERHNMRHYFLRRTGMWLLLKA